MTALALPMAEPDAAAPPNPLAGALDGVRIVDFGQIAAGPLCTMLLADMGAEVIKVEPPAGDVGRTLGPPFIEGESAVFLSLNRGKKSVVIDLKTAGGKAEALALIESADILVESFRPGVADRLGIGYAAMRARFPALVYCSISAYGQTGPWAQKPGVDGVLQAVTGLMSITGAEGEAPSKVQAPVVDMVTGFQAAIAILAALRQRDAGGAPGQLDISLFASSLVLQQAPLTAYLATGETPRRCGSGAPYATPNEAYETSDGYILIAAYQPERWTRFCCAIGRPEIADHPCFATLEARMEHRLPLTGLIEAALRRRTTAEWLALLEGQDIICAPVADYATTLASPQIAAAGLLVETDHAKAGRVAMPGFSIGRRPPSPRSPAPMLGEHQYLIDPAAKGQEHVGQ